MFTGWWPSLKFPLNRPLTKEERAAELPSRGPVDESFDDRNSLVALNSTYIEWVDRRFLVRGAVNTGLVSLGALFFVAWTIFFIFRAIKLRADSVDLFGSLGCSLIGVLGIVVLYLALLRYDYFKRIYYPIRFNRRNQMIYVYRDKRDGGILSVPWGKVFFHIGKGRQNTRLCDIRGEILEDKLVKDTFALGHFFERPQPVQQMWAFIRRYMEGGPESVGENPLDRYVELSVKPSFKNCFLMVYTYYGAPTAALRMLSLPFIALSTVTRWLVFKTCTMPVWPAEIEEACRVDPDDPNIWPVAETIGQFAASNPAIMMRAAERARGEAGPSSLADALGDWQKDVRRKK